MITAVIAVTSKQATLWTALGLFACIGVVAIISPRLFGVLATRSGRWIDTNKLFEVFDKRFDIDH